MFLNLSPLPVSPKKEQKQDSSFYLASNQRNIMSSL